MTQTEVRAQSVVADVEGSAGRIERRSWFRVLARAGLSVRSVIYFLIAYLTADIALHGGPPAPADSNGALHEISREPAGPAILFLVAVGLMGYAIWRLVSAAAAENSREHVWVKRIGLAASGVAYLGLCARVVAFAVGSGHTNSASSNPAPVAATVLHWPAGPLFLALCAAGCIGGGLALAIWGWSHDYGQTFDRRLMTHPTYNVARVTGIVGDTTRGLLIGLLGVYLTASAVTDDPAKVKGLDQALQALAHQPYGIWPLSLACFGLFSFGLYSGFEARYRRI